LATFEIIYAYAYLAILFFAQTQNIGIFTLY